MEKHPTDHKNDKNYGCAEAFSSTCSADSIKRCPWRKEVERNNKQGTDWRGRRKKERKVGNV
jgi:hypothetical protein